MSTKGHSIVVSGLTVDVVRKDIKNLHVGVYPPNGRVRVAAPLRLNDDAVRLAVANRLGWIRRQQASFKQQERQSVREMVTGETHYVFGRRYRLNVIETSETPTVRLRPNGKLELCVRPGSSRQRREDLLNDWYRQILRERIPELVARWGPKLGVRVADWAIRKMKTRWGSCNPSAKRIWINLELAKKPHRCLEFILVHEMVHLIRRHHDLQFQEHMNRLVPNWTSVRHELNTLPLPDEDWDH